jgi:hypothetical protein
MKMPLPRPRLRRLQVLGRKLNIFFAGLWYWSLTRKLAERHLERALERYDNTALRRATQLSVSPRRPCCTYWRSTARSVRYISEQALKAGVPMEALRLVVLNTDLRKKKGSVYLRRSLVANVLSTMFATIVCAYMPYVCFGSRRPQTGLVKTAVILIVPLVYCVLYYGWSLYTSRPRQAIAQLGHRLDEICAQAARHSLAQIHALTVTQKRTHASP